MPVNTRQGWTLETGHVGLNVTNLERSKKFYQEVLGLTVMAESSKDGEKYAFLGDGNKLVVTLFEQSKGKFDAHQPGLHHLSFQLS
jgi:catechol-2,3-dioxygenase